MAVAVAAEATMAAAEVVRITKKKKNNNNKNKNSTWPDHSTRRRQSEAVFGDISILRLSNDACACTYYDYYYIHTT